MDYGTYTEEEYQNYLHGNGTKHASIYAQDRVINDLKRKLARNDDKLQAAYTANASVHKANANLANEIETAQLKASKSQETRSEFYLGKIRDRDAQIKVLSVQVSSLQWAIKNFKTGA